MLPIISGCSINYFYIPPRSESVHFIQTEFKTDCVICSWELQDGLCLASSIASPINGMVTVRILNTTDKNIKMSDISLKYINLVIIVFVLLISNRIVQIE